MKQLTRFALCLGLGALALLPASACTSGELPNDDFSGSSNAPGVPGAAGAGNPQPGGAGSGNTAGGAPLGSAGAGLGSSGGSNGVGGSSSFAGGAQAGGTSTGGAAPVCDDLPPNNGDTCAHAVEYSWCSQSWMGNSCRQSCGKCGSGSAGATSSGGAPGGAGATGSAGAPPVIVGGTSGWATRYWDCCKPACGWKANVPANSKPVSSCNAADQSLGSDYNQASACPNGNNGGAFMCHDFGPWAVSDTLAYGFAAVSKGSDYCGRCYQLQFTGGSHNATTDPGSAALAGKTMIVQAINNGGVGGDQFDLLIPGGGVGEFNACSTQWGTSSLGEQYGGFFLECQKKNGFDYAKSKACAAAKCQTVFASKPDLLTSCTWFTGWFGAPDNPALKYKEVDCPAAITAMSGLKR